ncbi:hypothetical protein CHARACLAT_032109 [Characodon lateralis]|uniref:Uncharacterized protein n=1 Tax=Characodon lateralis TaxID=208331 RepID=A0ABU7EEU7_9TELE|nr:hypothetical protein [Characodon lateralis]
MATRSAVPLSESPPLSVRCSVTPLPPLVIMIRVINVAFFVASLHWVSELEARLRTVEKPADSRGPLASAEPPRVAPRSSPSAEPAQPGPHTGWVTVRRKHSSRSQPTGHR